MSRAQDAVAIGIVLSAGGLMGYALGRSHVPDEVKPKPVVGVVATANALEAKLEARVRWEAAKKCRAGEFPKDSDALAWLKDRFPKCQGQANKELMQIEEATLHPWDAAKAADLWEDWAKQGDPSLGKEAE